MVFGGILLGLNKVVDGGSVGPPTIVGSTITVNQSVNTITNPDTCRLVNDGSTLWVSSRTGATKPFYRYDLSTAFDISGVTSANYDAAFLNLASTNPDGVDFSPDGSYFGFVGGSVLDIHSASGGKTNVGSLVLSRDTVTSDGMEDPIGISWVTDDIIIICTVNIGTTKPRGVHRYTFSSSPTPSLTYHSSFDTNPAGIEPLDVFMWPDGSRFWIIDNSYVIYEYDMSTPYDITTASQTGSNNMATGNIGVGGSVSRGIHIEYDSSNNAVLFLAEDGVGDEQLHRFYIT